MGLEEGKQYCDQHSGNMVCIQALKASVDKLIAVDREIARRNEESHETIVSLLEQKVPYKLFMWVMGGFGGILALIVLTILGIFPMIYEIDKKVEVSISQQGAIKNEIQYLRNDVGRIEKNQTNGKP